MRPSSPTITLAICLLAAGCNRESEAPDDLPGIDVGETPDGGEADAAGESNAPSFEDAETATVYVSAEAPEAVRIAAQDVVDYLRAMDVETTTVDAQAGCADGTLAVNFADGTLAASATQQTYRIAESWCDGGSVVELSGGGLLGRQYAAYAWLHELGIRFFHPEDEFVPPSPRWPLEPLDIQHTPDFEFRSVSLHLTHPLELGDPFRLEIDAYANEARRFIDWQIKNFASFGTNGAPFDGLRDYGVMRGLPRSSGFSLHNQQQGGGGIIDADSPLTDEQQIARAIDQEMGDDPARYPDHFHFTFNPSEFTELPDETIVRQLTFIANYIAENYPDTIVMATNHGTAGPPTENYMVRFYDLPQFAPPNLGVKVHTLMFYDLERPAPVYGNENFNNLFEFMQSEYETRRLWYFPESAWWLTFDLPVPLYLPITIEARDRDLQKIAFMLDGKLDGHRVFGSGHEWGYWQNEYCSLRMSADLDYRWTNCVDDITAPMGPAADVVADAVREMVALQQRHLFDAQTLRWIVGSDSETELAAQIGVEFHPLPPLPAEMMRWSAAEVAAWEATVPRRLQAVVDGYAPIVEILRDAETDAPEASFHLVNEIADGAEANMLRAKHNLEVYSAIVAMRKHRLGVGEGKEELARQLLEQAEGTTDDVARITRSRSDYYRYKPRTRAIAGGEDGTEDDNWTGYSYRYLNRAHHAFYYRRIDNLAREAIDGVGAPFEVPNVVLAPGEMLTVTMLDDAITDVTVDLGDGEQSSERLTTHTYADPGVYPVTMSGSLESNPWSADYDVAQLAERVFTGRTGVLLEPETELAGQIEAVLPSLVIGPADDGNFILGTAPGDDPLVPIAGFSVLPEISDRARFEAGPADVEVPLSVGGETSMTLTVLDSRVEQASAGAPVFLTGDLRTEAVVDAIVGLSGGAFDPVSARALVADALGYTVDTLPETVPFTVQYEDAGA